MKQLIVHKIEAKTPKTRPSPIPSTSTEIETPKQGFIPGIRNDDNVDDFVTEEESQTCGREEYFGTVASPWLFLYKQYGIRMNGELLLIGDTMVVIDTRDNIIIKGKFFKGTEGYEKY